jgi:nucleoside-diphosphate-sugar epimerase
MKVLLTGAFGNVGVSTLHEIKGRGHQVRCFDLKTPLNEKVSRDWAGEVEIRWGDITNPADVAAAMQDIDVVLHLAAIIPPLSEKNPALAEKVNVGGTQNLVAAMQAQPKKPKIVMASSISVHGKQFRTKLLTVDEPLKPGDHYSGHKIQCEKMLRESGLTFCILRLNAVMPLKLGQMDPIMFELALDSEVEYVHTRDVGLAFANAVDCPDVWGKTFFIGGGPTCRFLYREFFTKFLDTMGIGMLPEEAYGTTPFYTCWMDTDEGQRLLAYQRYNYDDYMQEIARLVGWRKPFIIAFRPFIRRWILSMSPYYKQAKTGAK